jgi:hypothetical protein
VPPFVTSGLTTGLLIAIIDAAAIAAPGTLGINGDLVELIDLLANIALYSHLGLRVGRASGVVREAAEAGVVTALVAATIGVAMASMLGGDAAAGSLAQVAIRTYALNIALGGVLAVVNGWLGAKAHQSGSARRS